MGWHGGCFCINVRLIWIWLAHQESLLGEGGGDSDAREGLHLVNYLWSIAWDLRAVELERENFQCITQFWSACQPAEQQQQREEYLGTTTTEMLSKRRGGNCITTTNIFTAGPITQKPSGQEKCIQRHVTHCLKNHFKMSRTISNIPTWKKKIGMKPKSFEMLENFKQMDLKLTSIRFMLYVNITSEASKARLKASLDLEVKIKTIFTSKGNN